MVVWVWWSSYPGCGDGLETLVVDGETDGVFSGCGDAWSATGGWISHSFGDVSPGQGDSHPYVVLGDQA